MAPLDKSIEAAKETKRALDEKLAAIAARCKSRGDAAASPAERTASIVKAQHQRERELDQRFEDIRAELAKSAGRTDEVLRGQRSIAETQQRTSRKLGRLLHAQMRQDEVLRGGAYDSPGKRFGRSPELKSWLADRKGLSRPVNVGSFFKATPLATGAATNLVVPERRGIENLIEIPQRKLRMRDLIPAIGTDKGSIEFFKELGFMAAARGTVSSITRSTQTATVTTAAPHGLKAGDRVSIRGADQAEYNGEEIVVLTVGSTTTFTYTVTGSPATPATGTITWANNRTHGAPGFVAEGAAKPEAELTLEREVALVQKIAHFIKITDEALDDIPRLEGLLDSKLIYGLKYKEDAALLYGSGSGEILGFLNEPMRQQYAWSDGTVGDNKGDAIRRAIGVLAVALYEATASVMHPIDWEDIELLKDAQERYLYVQISNNDGTLGPRFWRLPIVETTAIAQGSALVGAFAVAATLYDREQANVRIGEEQDDMTKNKKTMLAEERLGLTIDRPESFCEVTFDQAPA